jgi:hypothetical protein
MKKLFFTFLLLVFILGPISSFAEVTHGLVAYYPFDGDAKDYSGNNLHGVESGGVEYQKGVCGKAVVFDGVDDYIQCFHAEKLNISGPKSTWSIACWLNTPEDPSAYFLTKNNSSTDGWNAGVTKNGKIIGRLNMGRNTYSFNVGTNNAYLDDREWHFVYIEWDAAAAIGMTSIKIFVDGILTDTHIICSGCWYESGMDYNNLGDLLIGKNANQNYPLFYKGLVDELRIYNRSLAVDEIQALYQMNCDIEVEIDIRPGGYPNTINLGSNGGVPVAIFGSADFDVTTIDPLTITLAGAPVRIKKKGTPHYSLEDINSDGFMDMMVHIDTQALQLSEADTIAALEGQTHEKAQFRGEDTVRILD